MKLKAETDATKAIEANSVADKAIIATAKANAALKATVVIVDAPEAKFETTSTVELLSVNTAFGGNLTNTVTGDAPEAKLADSTAVEPISAADEIDVEAAEVNSDAAKGNSDVVAAEGNFAAAGDNFNAAGNVSATLSVKNKVVTTSAEAKFNASTPEADQANFDVAAEDNSDAAGDNCNAAGTAAAGAKATA